MKETDKKEICPVRDIIARLSDKWSLLVIIVLHREGTARFSKIQKELDDISQRMLTVTLRSLEADGLVSRRVFAEIPPRVEYELTALGESLLPPLQSLVKWALENKDEVLEQRKAHAEKVS
jgi:Predicted transcriptional regulators